MQGKKTVKNTYWWFDKNKILYTVIVVYLIVTLSACSDMLNGDKPVSLEINANLPYVLTKPKLNVKPDHKFVYKVKFDQDKIKKSDPLDPYSNIVEVYCDAGLTTKARDARIFSVSWKKEFTIKPDEISIAGIDSEDNKVKFTKEGEWGFHDEYYIVWKVDSKTGQKLEKPLVTRFTVEKNIKKPEISFSVDKKGFGHFKWNPIEGAVKYYLVSIDLENGLEQILGVTDKTEWTTDDTEQKFEVGDKVYIQNRDFSDHRFSEDDKHGKDYIELAELQKFTKKIYGVIAKTKDGMSPYSFINGDEIVKTLPNSVAINAASEMKALKSDVSKIDDIPAQMPITMGDGSTVLRPIVIDINEVKIEEQVIYHLDKNHKVTRTEKFDGCVIPYVVDGTVLNGKYIVKTFDKKTYKDKIKDVIARNNEAQVKTGLQSTQFEYSTQVFEPGNLPISKTAPDVPYKVTATNSFTKYLAANMIEGNEYIDVSKYVESESGIKLNDALLEALLQNPYILGVNKFEYFSEIKVLNVIYNITDEERKKEQKDISDEVDRVISKIINPGMKEEEKVKAINDYITKTASYDYDAYNALKKGLEDDFKHAWSPSGVLLRKKAVCGGYAEAFKVLADKAGVESVYVSGITNGERHAWNKVKVNGLWRVIDTTWNDTEYEPNSYYLLTDKQAEETRTQEDLFVIDMLVSNYAAN